MEPQAERHSCAPASCQGRRLETSRFLTSSLRLGGFLVNPEEIESFLQSLPGVSEAQAVAAEHNGKRVAFAFIRPAPGSNPDEQEILAACRASLARFKQPVRVIAVEAFPVADSPNGVKIQRAKLREMANAILNAGTL